jgi:ketosteroid isomerase-like protein
MSQANVEIVRRWLWAFEHDDDAFRRLTHPEIEWAPFEENHTVFHGLAGAMQIRSGWLDSWSEHDMDIEEVLDGAGEDVMASLQLNARGAGSGADVDVRLHGHFKIRDGRVAYLYEYQDRAEALEAVGLAD